MLGHFFFFQLPNSHSKAYLHFVPKQKKVVMLWNPKFAQPTANGVELFGGATTMIINDVFDLEFVLVLNGVTKFFTYYDSPNREQSADSWLAVMHAAPAILQQRAGSLGSVGEQVNNEKTGVVSNIDLSIGFNHLPHSHTLFLGDIVDILGIENNRFLMDAAFPASAALESELGVQVKKIFLQLLNPFA